MGIVSILLIGVYIAFGLLVHASSTPNRILWKFGKYNEDQATEFWTDIFLWLPIFLIMLIVKFYYKLRTWLSF